MMRKPPIILIALFLISIMSNAQEKNRWEKLKLEEARPVDISCCYKGIKHPPKEPALFVKSYVADMLTGKPIQFATVLIKGTGRIIIADSAGVFAMQARLAGTAEFEVSAIGYKTATGTVGKDGNLIFLMPAADELEDVVVYGTRIICRGRIALHCNTETESVLLCKIPGITIAVGGEEAKEVVAKKEVKIFPNPLRAGNNLQVALKTPGPGQYRIDLMDASGRVLFMQSSNIKEGNYNFSVPTQNTWSAGVYFVRITGQGSTIHHTSQIVVQ